MHAYQLDHAAKSGLVAVNIDAPEPGPSEVRVRVEAVSLNYRDLLTVEAARKGGLDGRIPVSDGAGRIDAVGAGVTGWEIGDRVAASFFRDWIDGPFRSRYMPSALGGNMTNGMLAEHVVLPAAAIIGVPAHLSIEEAATLPCAGVTAWHGLVERAGLQAGDTLLIQGTGGVALFALQFASALGARSIVLSSSDEKLSRAKALGASVLINYRTTPDWDVAVMEATGGAGATHILELGGPDTYDRSIRSVASAGKIVQVGVLTGFGSKPDLTRLQFENADILGVTVGSVEHFRKMNEFLLERQIKPTIDRVFGYHEVKDAYAYLRSGAHFGKVVVTV